MTNVQPQQTGLRPVEVVTLCQGYLQSGSRVQGGGFGCSTEASTRLMRAYSGGHCMGSCALHTVQGGTEASTRLRQAYSGGHCMGYCALHTVQGGIQV